MATYYMSGISLVLQYLTNVGIVNAGGFVNTYVGGSVSTPLTTYTDSTGTVQNPNPMTLNSAGRPAAASGAPVAFWLPEGSSPAKLVVTDQAGNLLVQLDNIPSLNDISTQSNALKALLANPASSNVSGSGPVAGADLVANAVKSYDIYADVRAANAPVLATGQTLNIDVQGGNIAADQLGGTFFWDSTSTAADDAGNTVLKPNSLTGAQAGRYRRYFGQGVPQSRVLSADVGFVSNAALANVAGMLISGIQPGTYLVQLRLKWLGTGGTAQGYSVALTYSGSTSGVSPGIANLSGNGTPAQSFSALTTNTTSGTISATNGDYFNLDVMVTFSSVGNLQLQACQGSSSPNTSTLKAGSLLNLTRFA